MRAADSGQWLRLRGEPVSDRMAQLDIDFDEVDEWVKVFGEQESKWHEFFTRNSLSPMELTYEDLVTDYQVTVLGVLDYLGLMPRAGLRLPTPRLERQSDDLTERAVAAYMNRKRETTASAAMSAADSRSEKDSGSNTPAEAFRVLDRRLQRPAASFADTTASYLFELSGESGGSFHVLVRDGLGSAGPGSIDDPDLTVALSAEDFMAMVQGDLDAQFAYITGKMTMRGDQALGPLLGSLLNEP
jgi:hypothetical protein